MNSGQLRRHDQAALRRIRPAFAAVAIALNLGLLLALAAPTTAHAKARHKADSREKADHTDHRKSERLSKEPFGDVPKGPLQIFISINQQKLHLYSDGVHVADTSVATGVPSLPTPLGVFSVIQKQVFHRSNIYSNAPMPYMQRITWSGVALHEGENIGHRASHGCIRMPRDFAVRLYALTRLGARVIIANGELKPSEFADPHLFVHKDRPPESVAASTAAVPPAAPPPVQTAQSTDDTKADDTTRSAAADSVTPAMLGLRVESDPAGSGPVVVADLPPAATQAASAPAMPAAISSTGAPEVPVPAAKPVDFAKVSPAKNTPIAIFVSRKEKRIYVRQDFEPLFDAAINIAHPDQPLGTHVFTAMNYLDDHKTFRWTVVSLPGEPPQRRAADEDRSGKHARRRHRDDDDHRSAAEPPPQTPAQALARLDIPQPTIDAISELMVPGSSLIVSDQGLGDETGEGTDFIVVTR